ncbi:MAG: DUF885 domain-containing protein [Verrucomicrobia bacterium]|nr:DUF885 domain-containing protein [Verrucomicrobiota bacterium]
MKRWKRVLLWTAGLGAAGVLVLAVFVVNAVWFKPWSIRVFFERAFIAAAFKDPELLSTLGLIEQFGLRGHNARLTDASPAHTEALLRLARENLETLRRYDRGRLSRQDQLSARILDWFLQTAVEGERFAYHDFPVNQFQGIQSQLPEFLTTIHRVNDDRDAVQYIARLRAIPAKWEGLLASLQLREERGILPPRFVIQRVLAEMRDFVAQPEETNALVRVFGEKLDQLPGLTGARKAALKRDAGVAWREFVRPAYQRLIDYCAALEPKTTTDDGVWRLPDGEAYYAWCLLAHTTVRTSAAEIHELGLRDVARIEAEMRAILDAAGHRGETPGVWLQRLGKQAQFLHPNTDEGRAEALAAYQRIAEEMMALAPRYFARLPRAGMEVRRVPEFKEATSPAAYYNMPAMDGSRPGIFFVNLRDLAELPKFGMKTLTYHEAVPGHHFQIALALEMTGVPTFRKLGLFNAYAEGWALYAERLAKEIGLYEADPYGDLGRLQDEMLRAVRLVVDTGIHAKRWTREQAIAYMVEKTGMAEPSVVSEVERYIVAPGQACAYKVGMMKLLAFRERARAALGAQFDLREFHRVVLENGAMPLEILEQQVNDWIAAGART